MTKWFKKKEYKFLVTTEKGRSWIFDTQKAAMAFTFYMTDITITKVEYKGGDND